jgi:hypothetical protein
MNYKVLSKTEGTFALYENFIEGSIDAALLPGYKAGWFGI